MDGQIMRHVDSDTQLAISILTKWINDEYEHDITESSTIQHGENGDCAGRNNRHEGEIYG